MSPSGASSPLSCSSVTPGSTTATWFSVSISRIRFMRSKASRMPSATGTAAPESPVPLPRATTGTPCSLASLQDLGHLAGRAGQHDGQRDDGHGGQRLVVGVVGVDRLARRRRGSRRRPCAAVPGVPTCDGPPPPRIDRAARPYRPYRSASDALGRLGQAPPQLGHAGRDLRRRRRRRLLLELGDRPLNRRQPRARSPAPRPAPRRPSARTSCTTAPPRSGSAPRRAGAAPRRPRPASGPTRSA